MWFEHAGVPCRAEGAVSRSPPASKGFLIPSAWEAGSARLLQQLGFEAVATTSAGLAWSLGRQDGAAGRGPALASARALVDATSLPVSADLENGFGPYDVAVVGTLHRAADAGLAGLSIEDASGERIAPIYDFAHAVERIAAVAEANRKLAAPLVLTARAENFLHGRPDLDDTIRRLVAFEAAGADVLSARRVEPAIHFFSRYSVRFG